jgi:pseudaminic acid cytidylyltransferase
MNIAVIPARGGSKRISRKNIKLFHGLPIIAYAIKAAKESEIFDQIIVSTEDDEIAEIARSFGAKTPWIRSKDLSDDYANTASVMQDAVKKLNSYSDNLEDICCIYPATPFLSPRYLQDGLKILKEGDWDYVVSATKATTPPERSIFMGEGREIMMRFPEHEKTRTQDFQTSYYDAGQFYWGKETSWKCNNPILSSKSTILELPRKFAIDIDTTDDWHYAEQIFRIYEKGTN